MGRHNGLWVPAHEGALEHEKTLKAGKVLTKRLGTPPECAPAIAFTATLRLELYALKQGESGIIGFMPDGLVGSTAYPEACWAAKGRRRRTPEEVGKALREALHLGGQLVGAGAEERVHDFRDHCRHIVSDRERKRIREPDKGPVGGVPRTDEPDHVADSVGGARGIPSKASPAPHPGPNGKVLRGGSAEPPRKLHGGSAESANGHPPGEVVKTELGAEFHRACAGLRSKAEVAASEALLVLPKAWAVTWAAAVKPGQYASCFDLKRAMIEARYVDFPDERPAGGRSGPALVRLEDDPGWSPAAWPRLGESAQDYASRTGLPIRDAKAGLVVAKRRASWDRVPASG